MAAPSDEPARGRKKPTSPRKKPARKPPPKAPPAEDLSDKKRLGVEAILTTPTLVKAAQKVGVSEHTIHNWLADPEFRKALDQAHDEAFHQAVCRLKRLTLDAVNRLGAEMMAGTDADPTGEPCRERITAADKLLAHSLRFLEASEMRSRVAALEARLAELSKPTEGPDATAEHPGNPGA